MLLMTLKGIITRTKDVAVLLKHKLYTSLITATFLPLCILTFLFSVTLKELTVAKLTKEDLPVALSNVRNAIEWELSEPIATSRSIAKNLFVEQWIKDGEPAQLSKKFIAYLNNVKVTDDAISAFIVSKSSKNYYSYSGEIRPLSYPSDNWFLDFLALQEPYTLVVDINPERQKAKVYVNYAIEIDGVKQGIGGISHSVEEMIGIIENQKIGKTGFVYLVDNEGIIKLHPDQTLIGNTINLNGIIYGQQKTQDHNNIQYIVSSMPLQSLDWHLVAQIPSQELYGPIERAIKTNLIYVALVTFLGIFIIILFVNRMFKPIENITASVSTLATKITGKQ